MHRFVTSDSATLTEERTERADAVHDPDRLAELAATGLLDRHSEAPFDRITALAQRILGAPVATVSLVGDDAQHFLGYTGTLGSPATDAPSVPLSHSFCQYAVATGERLVIEDARRSPLLRRSPVTEDLGVVAYAGHPLETAGGHVLGTLCLMDGEAREWSDADLDILAELAALAASEIDFRLRARAMARIEQVARELHTPVEQLGDAVRSVAASADRGAPLPRVARLAALAAARVEPVEALDRQLREVVRRRARIAPVGVRVKLAERVERAVRVATVAARAGAVTLDLQDVPAISEHDPHLLERGLSHLLVTALHHADDSGAVAVTLAPDGDDGARLDVEAPGGPMPVAELAGVVARLDEALGAPAPDAAGGAGRCALSMAGRSTVAEAGPVRAATGPDGTVVAVRFAGGGADAD